MIRYETIDITKAKKEGLTQMTNTYDFNEFWMLDNVVADLSRGRIPHRLVLHPKTETHPNDEVSVWR